MRASCVIGLTLVSAAAMVVAALACVVGAETGLTAKPEKASVSAEVVQNVDARIERLLADLRSGTTSADTGRKFGELLDAIVQKAVAYEADGDTGRAYLTLRQGETREAIALSAGVSKPAVAIFLAQFRSRLLYTNGSGLLTFLRSKVVSSEDKTSLLAMLEAVVKQEAALPPSGRAKPDIPGDVQAQLNSLLAKRRGLESRAKGMTGEAKEQVVRQVLETYTASAEVLWKAGLAAKVYQVLLEGNAREIQEGLGGSERSVVSYDLGKFLFITIMQNGDHLLDVLHSREITLEQKGRILFELKDAVRRGDI